MSTLTGQRTRPNARALALARAAWVMLSLALVGSLIINVPPYFREAASRPSGIVVPDGPAEVGILLRLLAEVRLDPERYALYQVAWRLAPSLLYLSLSLLLFLRRRRDPGALVMATVFLLSGAQGGRISHLLPASPPRSPAEALYLAFGVLSDMATPLAFYLLPNGRFVPRWTRWLAMAIFVLVVPNNLLRGTRFDPLTYPALNFSYGIASIVTFVYAPLYRYFRVADAVQRQQLKWVLVGLLATPLAWVINILLHALFPAAGQPTAMGLRFELAYMAWSTPLYLLAPLAIGFAVLRYRLWDIDVIVRRTLIYSALSAVLALAYFGSVLALEGLFRALTGQGQSSLVIVLSTLAIAALFGPVRRRVQLSIDRRFYRRKYDAARTLAGFGAAARDEVDLNALTRHLTAVVDETMQPASVDLWLRPAAPRHKARPP
jgi:hypothetical protein